MGTSNTVIRSMHDVGLAVWCGGALMGGAFQEQIGHDDTLANRHEGDRAFA